MTEQPQSCGSCRWAKWDDEEDELCRPPVQLGMCIFPLPVLPSCVVEVDMSIGETDGESCPCYSPRDAAGA